MLTTNRLFEKKVWRKQLSKGGVIRCTLCPLHKEENATGRHSVSWKDQTKANKQYNKKEN